MERSMRLGCCLAVAVLASLPLASADAGMELTIEAKQKTFRLGEPVTFLVSAENRGREPVTTSVVLAPSAGFVQFFVSEDGEEFKQYVGPGWGTRDVFLEPRPVAPGERFEMTYALLWHHVIPGEDAVLREALPFRKEGCYLVKASSLLRGFDRESNTVEVCLTEPEGDDLAVWDAILATPELARFIQHPLGEPNPDIPARAAALLAEHPTSSYAPSLREAVRARREVEAPTAPRSHDP